MIPEVVKRGEFEVGRFEVTRAQFAAFDPAYAFAPGTENYPANNVSFEKAKAYAEWLSKTTGENWRLPNEDEAAKLYEGLSGENTLDYWAGYALNPDDARRARDEGRRAWPGGTAPQGGRQLQRGRQGRRGAHLRPRRERGRMGGRQGRDRKEDGRLGRQARGPESRRRGRRPWNIPGSGSSAPLS